MEAHQQGSPNANLEAWKQTIEVQQHFNSIELQIRNYAVTLLAALFGVVAYAFKEGVAYELTLGVLGAGLVVCYAFYFMDRHWYHRLLVGAVKHGTSIENESPPEMGLTKAISAESPLKWWCGIELHAEDKILIFYWMLALPIIVMGVLILLWAPPAPSVIPSDQLRRSPELSTQSRQGQSTRSLPAHPTTPGSVAPQ